MLALIKKPNRDTLVLLLTTYSSLFCKKFQINNIAHHSLLNIYTNKCFDTTVFDSCLNSLKPRDLWLSLIFCKDTLHLTLEHFFRET